jgi:hypothetical protein
LSDTRSDVTHFLWGCLRHILIHIHLPVRKTQLSPSFSSSSILEVSLSLNYLDSFKRAYPDPNLCDGFSTSDASVDQDTGQFLVAHPHVIRPLHVHVLHI